MSIPGLARCPLGGHVLAVTLAQPPGPGTNVADVPGPALTFGLLRVLASRELPVWPESPVLPGFPGRTPYLARRHGAAGTWLGASLKPGWGAGRQDSATPLDASRPSAGWPPFGVPDARPALDQHSSRPRPSLASRCSGGSSGSDALGSRRAVVSANMATAAVVLGLGPRASHGGEGPARGNPDAIHRYSRYGPATGLTGGIPPSDGPRRAGQPTPPGRRARWSQPKAGRHQAAWGER